MPISEGTTTGDTMSEPTTNYEKPEVERFGTFRDLTQFGECYSGYKWWTYGCNDDVPGDDSGRS